MHVGSCGFMWVHVGACGFMWVHVGACACRWGGEGQLMQGVKGGGGRDETNHRVKLMGEILLATCMVP